MCVTSFATLKAAVQAPCAYLLFSRASAFALACRSITLYSTLFGDKYDPCYMYSSKWCSEVEACTSAHVMILLMLNNSLAAVSRRPLKGSLETYCTIEAFRFGISLGATSGIVILLVYSGYPRALTLSSSSWLSFGVTEQYLAWIHWSVPSFLFWYLYAGDVCWAYFIMRWCPFILYFASAYGSYGAVKRCFCIFTVLCRSDCESSDGLVRPRSFDKMKTQKFCRW